MKREEYKKKSRFRDFSFCVKNILDMLFIVFEINVQLASFELTMRYIGHDA